MPRLAPLLSLLLGCCAPLLVQAEPVAPPKTPMAFSVKRLCVETKCESVLLGQGAVMADSHEVFAQAMGQVLEEGLDVDTVVLQSLGGDLAGGLKLGALLRTVGVSTRIIEDSVCASACAYAFLGGRTRTVSPQGYFAVHRFAAVGADPGADSGQRVVNALTQYIEGMGVSPTLLRLAAQANPSELVRLTPEQNRALNVDNTRRDKPTWIISANEDSLDVMLKNHALRNDRLAVINLRRQQDKVLAVALFQEPLLYSQAITRVELADDPFLTLCRVTPEGRSACVHGQVLRTWRQNEETREFVAGFVLPVREMDALAQGNEEDQIVTIVGSKGLSYPLLIVPSSARGFKTTWRAASQNP